MSTKTIETGYGSVTVSRLHNDHELELNIDLGRPFTFNQYPDSGDFSGLYVYLTKSQVKTLRKALKKIEKKLP